MMHFRHSVSLMIILALTLVFIGCEKPPESDKSAAKAAMDTAVSSGADKYDAADLEAAGKIWDVAEAEMKEEKYKEAKQSYVAAKAAFDIAAGNAAEGKKIAIAEANAVVASLEVDWTNLKTAAKNVEKKMKHTEMQDAWGADTEAFTKGLKVTKDKIVTDPAGVKADVVQLRSIIEKWDAAFTKLTAAPSQHKATKKKAKATKKRNKGGKYSIQIRAYPETGRNAATAFVKELRKIQPDVHMERVYMRERGVWYRILVGHFENAEEASTYMKEKKVFKAYPGSFVQLTSE